jgi:hypothetical protein
VKGLPVAIGAVVAVGLLVGAVVFDRNRSGAEPVEVVFGEGDGLPEELAVGAAYSPAFVVGWSGPVEMRDGVVSVFASRKGDTSEDFPQDEWPLLCEYPFQDVTSRVRFSGCPFVAPGPGEFALILEVRASSDEVIGETLYTHLVVEPSELDEASSVDASSG